MTTYDANEIANTVKVQTQSGDIYTARVIGHALRFPKLVLRDGGTVEVSRPTLIACQLADRPVLV
ncbi:hypothetical protein [Microbacterium sp.]|uniref:hypothetical protein n=1 Tax=Microbacterium sp. TaxID=51671 RepID=UPI00261628F0|nr:hypothetical protein [Microbacterium sp.]